MSSPARAQEQTSESLVKVLQLPFIAGFLSVCLVHAFSILWVGLLPRYRRERFAFRICCDPWVWFTTKFFLKPRIRVIGGHHLPTSWKGFLYVSNHESLVDILVLTGKIRRAFLMKRTVLLSPMGWGTYFSGSVAVDRSSPEARQRALDDTLTMAKRSMSVIVFPEGTFGHSDGSLRKPHLKLLRRAYKEGLSIVPLGHAGTRRAVDGQSLPVRRNAEIVLAARPPVDPRDFNEADAFAQHCWQQVVAAVGQARQQIAAGPPYVAEP